MNSNIDIKADPISTIKVTQPTWQPGKGNAERIREEKERHDAFQKIQLESGKDLAMRVLLLEHAVADLQSKLGEVLPNPINNNN